MHSCLHRHYSPQITMLPFCTVQISAQMTLSKTINNDQKYFLIVNQCIKISFEESCDTE